MAGRPAVIPFGVGLNEVVASTRQPLLILDVRSDPRFVDKDWYLDQNLTVLYVVPRTDGDEVLGVLNVSLPTGAAPTDEEREDIGLFAAHAALAIKNARLFGEAEQRRREAEALAAIARGLTESLDEAEVGARIVNGVLALLGGSFSRLWRRLPDGSLKSVAWGGTLPPGAHGEGTFPAGTGVAGQATDRGRPVWVPDVLADPSIRMPEQYRRGLELAGARALLGVPLRVKGEITGSLIIADKLGRVFTKTDISILEVFADQAALALENARLYGEAEQRRREAEVLDDVARSFSAVLDLDTALQRVGEGARELCGADLARIALRDGEDAQGAMRFCYWPEARYEGWRDLRVVPGVGAGGVVFETGRPFRTEDYLNDPRVSSAFREVELIHKTADRAAGLTRQLLAFSRRQMLHRSVLDLNAVVTDTEVMLRRLIGEDVELVTVLDPGLSRVKADRGQIEQVLINLAVNARDAMPKGGRLTLSTANVELGESFTRKNPGSHAGTFVQLSVRDNGQGMDAAVQAQIFEPFFTTKEPGKGTGLGLSTVYGIVKQHEGYIVVASEQWRGTVFDMYLPPVEAGVAEPEGPLVLERGPSGRETILLVEDEEGVRELARDVLRGAGYRVFEAADPAEAMRLWSLYTDEIQLLLTDMVMPRMTGREIAETFAPVRPDLRLVYMPGHTDDPMVRAGETAVPGVFLKKPFSVDGLLQAARTALDGAISRQAAEK